MNKNPINSVSVRVPYDIRHEAKSRGGKWEPTTKTWRLSQAAAIEVQQAVDAFNVKNAAVIAARQPTELGGSMLAIVQKFRFAKDKGLKYPTLLFFKAGGFEKVKLTLAADSSKNPGFLYVKGDGAYCGKISTEGRFFGSSFNVAPERLDGLRSFLREFATDPVGVSSTNGKASGHCCYCGSDLTDNRSLNAGYGPVCAKHWDLPWGGDKSESVLTQPDRVGENDQEPPDGEERDGEPLEYMPPIAGWSALCKSLGCVDQPSKRRIDL